MGGSGLALLRSYTHTTHSQTGPLASWEPCHWLCTYRFEIARADRDSARHEAWCDVACADERHSDVACPTHLAPRFEPSTPISNGLIVALIAHATSQFGCHMPQHDRTSMDDACCGRSSRFFRNQTVHTH